MCKAEWLFKHQGRRKSRAHDAGTRKMEGIQGPAKTCKQILMTDLQASAADHVSTSSEASCMFGFNVLFQNVSQSCINTVKLGVRSDFCGNKSEIQVLCYRPS